MERGIELGTRDKGQRTGNDPSPRRKGDDIAERLLDAVEGVRQLLPGLRVDAASKHVAKQLWRAATGGGANYEEARGAESRADVVHKIRVATKELRELDERLGAARHREVKTGRVHMEAGRRGGVFFSSSSSPRLPVNPNRCVSVFVGGVLLVTGRAALHLAAAGSSRPVG